MLVSPTNFRASCFPLWPVPGSASEFDVERACSQNLTDFQTRVVWSSPDLRKYVQQICSPLFIFRKSPAHRRDALSGLTRPALGCCIDDAEPKFQPNITENAEKVRFWRPFSSDPAPKIQDENQQHNNVVSSSGKAFPTITPTTVKIGGSVKSVFRSVKKRKYQCQFCCMSYLNQGQLAGHIRIHTGSKPYLCDYPECSRAFARNEELTRHRRIHSGYKPHHCDICDKQFGRKDHLNKHRKTHLKASEKKVYLCQYPGCGHRYTRSDALTRHQASTHTIKSRTVDTQ